MESEKEKLPRHKHLAFIGEMVADLTQKVPGHLTTLQASAGRLARLVEQANQEIGEDTNRFSEILSSIDRHIDLLGRKIQILNRFSQRMGSFPAVFDPREIIEEAVLFSSRPAHMRNVSIKVELDENVPSLHNDPVSIHFLVSNVINGMLERVSRGGTVIVNTGAAEEMLMINIEGRGPIEKMVTADQDKQNGFWQTTQELITELGGRLEPENMDHSTKRISFFFPAG